MHVLSSDELFHFYLGDPVEMLQLWPDGRSEVVVLGPDLAAGQHVQLLVPAGVWQGTRLSAKAKSLCSAVPLSQASITPTTPAAVMRSYQQVGQKKPTESSN
jgi:predicted cupin superfamily sugar epimerase